MHSRIFEITSKPLDRDDYLTSGWLDPEQYSDFADYIDDDIEVADKKTAKSKK